MGHGDNAWGHRRLTAIDQRNEEPLLVPKRTQPMKQRGFHRNKTSITHFSRSLFGNLIVVRHDVAKQTRSRDHRALRSARTTSRCDFETVGWRKSSNRLL